ncbi:DUF5056 domain-containing protein [Bacteroides bouchesdurhonensis]|uniref:DUF5056 domain-containing protein n=1 Tax=Bacteroides bouchesdurhonensis TaxID=1841855 RepID=UPI0011DD2858|nr:DUF5056 domain-containing protein [Bacteroides bouchesdurhonensis]
MEEIDNDKLLHDFFAENKQEIADNGFSQRVMHHLPSQSNWLTRIRTALIVIIGTILFVWLGGVEATLRNMQEATANIDQKSLIIITIVLLCLGVKKICSLA